MRLAKSEVDASARQRDRAIDRDGFYEHVVSRIEASAAARMGLLPAYISEYTVAGAIAEEYQARSFSARVHGDEDPIRGEHDASGGYIDYHQAYVEVRK
jgi:hypothetical protein